MLVNSLGFPVVLYGAESWTLHTYIHTLRAFSAASIRSKRKIVTKTNYKDETNKVHTMTLKTSDKRRVNAFELWCRRRGLRISWIQKIRNEDVKSIAPNIHLKQWI